MSPPCSLAIVLIFYSIDSKFLSATNILNIMSQVSILMVVTVAASLVIFTGGFDLSAGSVVALTGVAAALDRRSHRQRSDGPCLRHAGRARSRRSKRICRRLLGVSPLIVTLGALNIGRGLALVIAGGTAVYSFPSWYTDFGSARMFGVPSLFVVALIVFAVFAFILRFTIVRSFNLRRRRKFRSRAAVWHQ